MENKKYKLGLILGKFLPPHFGHFFLIRTALSRCDNVIVLCCTLKNEPIDGRLRYTWLLETFWQEIQDKKLCLEHIEEDLPQYPHENPKFWDIWKKVISDSLDGFGKMEAIFSSELYGDRLADIFNCDHVCVDLDRTVYNVSGTSIRNEPNKNSEYISTNVSFYYAKKIVLAGPESVGKSTYSSRLANELDLCHVEEYGRTYYEKSISEKKLFTKLDIGLIAGGQLTLEQSRYEEKPTDLICDTDLVATEIFSYFYFNACPQWIKEHNRKTKYTLTILLTPETYFVQDGTRNWEDRWLHFKLLENFYKNSNRPYVIVNGSNHEDRYKQCLDWIKQVL